MDVLYRGELLQGLANFAGPHRGRAERLILGDGDKTDEGHILLTAKGAGGANCRLLLAALHDGDEHLPEKSVSRM